jgi:predicted Zn finger-like uncharacterized protein
MIQTCPACSTRFTVPETAFTQGPRKLRCAKCQHVWLAAADGSVLAVPETMSPETPPAVTALSARTATLAIPEAASFTPPPLPPVVRPSRVEKIVEKVPRLPPKLAWGVTGILLLLLLCGLWFGRYALAARFAGLESFYLMTGLIHLSDTDQLDLQLTRAEKCQVTGRVMLCLNGQVTNRGTKPVLVPALYITALDIQDKGFLNSDGTPILSWTVPAETGTLLPGDTRSFALTEPYPDKTITDFDYGFIDEDTP